jgi:hypothetical protein
LFSCERELPAPARLPALVMATFLIGKCRGQNWLRSGLLGDDERSLQQSLDANRFAAR